ncbi:MAG: NADH-quinone oxidoreductase subunit N [Flavobacteriia bacterium]|nr:NADH-quinone oxidoreductase subunit N [Flavobacteriia bacterium]
MIALITLFVTGLITLFVAFTRKPLLVGIIATIGLIGGLFGLMYESRYGIRLFPDYHGLNFDTTAVMFSFICIIFTTLLVWTGFKPLTENENHAGDHIALMIFSLCGALIMTSFTDFFMFFLGLEILSIPVYVLAGMKKSDALSSEASLKYFLTGSFATGILLFGIAWIYGSTGSFDLLEIKNAILNSTHNSSLLYVGVLLVLASFLFKIGAVPYHFWSPDVYAGSPATIMGFMASVVKIAAFAAIMRLFTDTFDSISGVWGPLVLGVSVLSMFVGNLSAIKQTRVRRLLAYSSIAHVGYALLAVVTFDSVETTTYHYNVYYYLLAYGLATIILITAENIINDESDDIENWVGIARKNPILGLFIIMAILSLAGVPPMMGFFGKYLIFSQAIYDYPYIVAIALLNSGIGIYYYLKLIVKVLRKPYEAPKFDKLIICSLQWIVLIISGVLLLIGGFLLLLF